MTSPYAALLLLALAAFGPWLYRRFFAVRSTPPEFPFETQVALRQLPALYHALVATGAEEAFIVVSPPRTRGRDLPDVEFSIESGRVQLGWNLESPANVRDRDKFTALAADLKYAVASWTKGDIEYPRVTDGDILALADAIANRIWEVDG